MKIIFGLGNPGTKYTKTRHNVGFLCLDYLAKKFDFPEFQTEQKFKAEISIGIFNGEKTILVKPQTFMNLSGESVQAVLHFYKIEKTDFLVIYDDKDLEFGKVRFRSDGSSGGHNGIKSIISVLGEEFKRLKIGVANEDLPKFADTADFVLSNFQKAEMEELPFLFEEAVEKLITNL